MLAAAVLHDTIRRFGEMLTRAEEEASPPDRLRIFVAGYFETRRRIAAGEEIPLAPFCEIYLVEGDQS